MTEEPTFEQWQAIVGTLAMNCDYCGPALRCPKCGNNCCNAGYGEIDGEPCDLCPSIYDVQDEIARIWNAT